MVDNSNERTETMKAGDGATWTIWTDSHAGTILSVSKSGKSLTWQRDKATLLNKDELKVSVGGFAAHVSGVQKYSYEPDPNGEICKFTLRKNGRFHLVGASARGNYLSIGVRAEHYDYNF